MPESELSGPQLSILPLLLHSIPYLLYGAFQLWMLVDAIRREEYVWALLILLGCGMTVGLMAIYYYIVIYRNAVGATRGFELPGAQDRRRIKHLQAQIHHLDKAHHYLELADIYFQKGKLPLAEQTYRASLQRDPEDIDARAHLGQCLLRLKRPEEAKPLLEGVCKDKLDHDYGHSLMALAETYTALGNTGDAVQLWERVLQTHAYARARVQVSELYLQQNKTEAAKEALTEVLADDVHAPTYQRRRDRVWVRRARAMLRKLK